MWAEGGGKACEALRQVGGEGDGAVGGGALAVAAGLGLGDSVVVGVGAEEDGLVLRASSLGVGRGVRAAEATGGLCGGGGVGGGGVGGVGGGLGGLGGDGGGGWAGGFSEQTSCSHGLSALGPDFPDVPGVVENGNLEVATGWLGRDHGDHVVGSDVCEYVVLKFGGELMQ